MGTYTQLTQEQRYQIYALLKMGHPQVEIAGVIGVHKSTISRELRRNRGLKGYRPKQAHKFASNRRKKAQYRIAASTWILIEELIRQEWSPEQVSDWLKVNFGLHISHEWIYQYILMDKHAGGDLHRHLRCQKKRRKRYGSYERRGKLKNRVSIDERPAIVDTRQRLGDWEVDTIIGKGHRHAIVSLTERKSRLALLRKVERKTAQAVADAVTDLMKSLPIRTHTITANSDREFAIMNGSLVIFVQMSILLIPIHPGSEPLTKTGMVSFACTFQRSAISPRSLRLKSNSSWRDSTTDPENALDSNHQIKYPSIIHPLLHFVVESKSYSILKDHQLEVLNHHIPHTLK